MSGLEGLLTGQTLVNRYRIGEVIGRGGFAAVYRAQDERLGRAVAVKVITLPAPDAAAAERHRELFEREARAAASLPQHPNVVTVYDFGIDPRLGLDFLVMEFLHGEDLATRLQRAGRPGLDAALRILREAAAGIAVGHRAGIVHRDVKPGNIFLARGEGAEEMRVCVLDFGIARLLADEERTLTGAPGEGLPLSPAYASPEQTRGVRDLTPASDVFSLGVVGYQLLTGEKPFPQARGPEPAAWVPRAAVRTLNPEVPAWLAAVIDRAMAYEPEARFADADDLCTALTTAADPDATLLAPPGIAPAEHLTAEQDQTLYQPPPELSPPGQRLVFHERRIERRRSLVGPLLFLLVLLGGGAGAWWYLTGGGGPDAFQTEASPELPVQVETGPEADAEQGLAGAEQSPPATVAPAPPETLTIDPGGTMLPPFDTLRADSAVDTGVVVDPLTGDTLAPDSAPTAPADSAGEPADTLPSLPPPRVIGVPVDSTGAARGPGTASPEESTTSAPDSPS